MSDDLRGVSQAPARGREPARLEPGAVRPPTLVSISSYLAGNVARAATRRMSRSLDEQGLRLGQHAVLSALRDFGPMAQYEIADRLDVDRSQVVGYVDRLEYKKFVIRTRDARDRRRVLISITAEGVSAERHVTNAARAIQADLYQPLSLDEQAQLAGLLGRVIDAYDAARLGLKAS